MKPSQVRISRDPTLMESRFIRNEVFMCACDADYYLTRYAYLKDPSSTIVRFEWRSSQRIFFRQLGWMEERNYSLEMQLLKARQQYMSTIVSLLQSHRVVTGYGVGAVSGSNDAIKSEELSKKLFFCIDSLPWWLKPTQKRRKEGKYLEFANSCTLTIQSGNQMSGIARGSTPTCIHLSELADYPNPEELIEASLFKAVHPNPKIFLMLESTGNSNVGWWANSWRFNKEHWSSGGARLYPLFIPWFINTELYPTPTWLVMHPVPKDWKPMEATVHHAVKCNAYVQNTDVMVRELGREWRLPREQMWFWEVNYQEHKAKRIEKIWLQEMPADDYEALQARNQSVFPYEVISHIEAKRERGYDMYSITGEGIEEKFAPIENEIDYSLPRQKVTFSAKGKSYSWNLIPLDPPGSEKETFPWENKLIVYEPPVDDGVYSMGVDTGTGSNQDRTVIEVNRVFPGSEPDIQVAEYASDELSAAESYAFVMAIGTWYACPDMPLTAVEQIRKPGDICQLQMKQMGWPINRFHRFVRYDGKKIQKGKSNRLGWYTNAWSRAMLLSVYIAAVSNGWYKVNSRYLKEELQTFEARSTLTGMTKMEHASGKHDDRIFASAISYFISHDLETMIERSKVRYDAPRVKLPDLVLGPARVNVVPFSQFWGSKFLGVGAGNTRNYSR